MVGENLEFGTQPQQDILVFRKHWNFKTLKFVRWEMMMKKGGGT